MRRLALVGLVVLVWSIAAFAQDTIEVKHPTFTPITFGATAPADLTGIDKFRLYVDGVIRSEVPVGNVQANAEFLWLELPPLAKGSHIVFCEAVGSVGGLVEAKARCINPSSLLVNVEGPNSPTGLGKKR
jgi:hypothetical protein